jgi:hypothetical protein
MSCQSTPTPVTVEEEQEEFENTFERVYNAYRSGIILDGATYYVVARGDTLSKIALKHYGAGNGYFFPLIMLASSDVVLDPDLIEPGMQLTVPDLQANLDDPAARGHVKNFLVDIASVYEDKGDAWSFETQQHLIELVGTL